MASTKYLTRKNTQWWRYDNVESVTVETLDVMSAEYRDLFTQTGDGWAAYGTYQSPEATAPYPYRTTRTKEDFNGQAGIVIQPGTLAIKTQGYTSGVAGNPSPIVDNSIIVATETVTAQVSDEVAHEDLRQTQLTVTHWKVDHGAAAEPRYDYITWADGDAWSDYPPGYLTTDNQ